MSNKRLYKIIVSVDREFGYVISEHIYDYTIDDEGFVYWNENGQINKIHNFRIDSYDDFQLLKRDRLKKTMFTLDPNNIDEYIDFMKLSLITDLKCEVRNTNELINNLTYERRKYL